MSIEKVSVPDIGGESDVDVIEVLVSEGDKLDKEQPIITLESDKASMDIPSPMAGIVKKVHTKVGDKVSEGAIILELETEHAQDEKNADEKKRSNKEQKSANNNQETSESKKETIETLEVPDIGGASEVDVIEVLVNEGDSIEKEQALITLEGDKATMDIPSPKGGIVKKLLLKVGDKVSKNDAILELLLEEKEQEKEESSLDKKDSKERKGANKEDQDSQENATSKNIKSEERPITKEDKVLVYASPSVRRFARELGVDLVKIEGSGRKGRLLKEDVQAYVKNKLTQRGDEFALPSQPSIDFSKFGEIETKPLNKIKRLTGKNVHRAWVSIPHVTQFDEADITELEVFRKENKDRAEKEGVKLTLLAFVAKALAYALKAYPQFNASLDESLENLILKHYYHIGIAVDTPNGLVVPVLKDIDKKGIFDIASEMSEISKKAREKGLSPKDMSGGCMTISSLGGIGGTAFTPIVNSPEVAILGLSRSQIKPVYQNNTKEFKPRLMLPLSLSYDHRVIDGAEAARFTRYLVELLSDIRRLIL
jgi:pyruvate dehydrogenase E2 component (dihydrolipoamide acetyltransferase)